MPISTITTNDTIGIHVTRTSQLITAYNTLESRGALNVSVTAQTAFGVANSAFANGNANFIVLQTAFGVANLAFNAANVANNLTVSNNGSIIGSRNILNFVPGGNVSISVTDDATNNKINVSISAIINDTFLTLLTRSGNLVNVAVN